MKYALAEKEQVRSKVNIQTGHLVIPTQRVPRTGLEDLNILLLEHYPRTAGIF